ncbi:transcription cofactor vestigial-like protein 1 isoform X5 [Aptenodytes patagonicus]|uniref:transcription cofactor vestigial-like protein 1 isoform X5 n=1 Tax=Aptenodytes patagonicus TaxID=9234 RepID=UPI003FA10E18
MQKPELDKAFWGCWLLKMEETRKLSPKPCKSKEPVKTEWGSQSVVFTYFQGDINSVVDEHFSRALSNAKNPQDLSTKHKGETVVLKNGKVPNIHARMYHEATLKFCLYDWTCWVTKYKSKFSSWGREESKLLPRLRKPRCKPCRCRYSDSGQKTRFVLLATGCFYFILKEEVLAVNFYYLQL